MLTPLTIGIGTVLLLLYTINKLGDTLLKESQKQTQILLRIEHALTLPGTENGLLQGIADKLDGIEDSLNAVSTEIGQDLCTLGDRIEAYR